MVQEFEPKFSLVVLPEILQTIFSARSTFNSLSRSGH